MKETHNISKFYWSAIVLMVLFMGIELVLLESFVESQSHTTQLMDKSGGQRMLSQRIALYSEMMADASNKQAFMHAQGALKETIKSFMANHVELSSPDTKLGSVVFKSQHLRQIYFEEPIHLDLAVRQYVQDATEIAETPYGKLDDENKLVRKMLYQTSSEILNVLDKTVKGYIEMDREAMKHLHQIALLFFATTFLFLIAVSFFVFRPMVKNIGATLAMMNLLKSIATAANTAASTEESLASALKSICEYSKWPVGHAYIYSEEDKKLISSHIWHDNEMLDCQAFKAAAEQRTYAQNEGFIGRVIQSAMPDWILDINQSKRISRQEAMIPAGLNAAYAFPVSIGNQVVAVMEFYAENGDAPTDEFLSIMVNIGKQLGQTFERTRSQQHAQLLETVIASANDGIIITKANLTDPGPEIIYVNDAFTKISGYEPSEAIGRSPRFLQGEFTKQETLQEISRLLKEGKPFKGEILNYSKNHEPYWLDMSIVPVKNNKGEITHYAALERDISQQKISENQFKETMIQLKRANMKAEASARDLQDSLHKAEEANKAKSDFLANMSHELRTPMNGVLGMAQLLKDTMMNDEQSNYVATINGSAETLLMLLNDILDFSKIEAGALELENIPLDIIECIQSSSNLIKPVADKKKVQLIVDNSPEISPFIMGDSARIRQIITNLVGNAVKFTEHGYVRVSTLLQEDETGAHILIQVEDTGTGIAQEKMDTIFEKFTQGDASITRKYGGTGLGLAITKQLVTLMRGTIGVNSVEGKGSTFWLTLPYRPALPEDIEIEIKKAESSKQVVKQLLPIHAAKALLVEDYPVNQIFAEKLLRKFGLAQIDLAENGMDALVKYRHNHYDVIFMDCQMPEMDGYQTTEHIRALEANTPMHTPIVAMTANAMMGDREKCLKAGMDDYVSKPLRIEHLKTVLKTLFVLEETPPHAPILEATLETNPSEPPVDMSQLQLFTDGNKEEERELFTLFLDQADEMLALLSKSIETSDNDLWKSAAHRFKGASGNLGATQLYSICKAAEKHADADAASKTETLALIRLEVGRVRQFAEKH